MPRLHDDPAAADQDLLVAELDWLEAVIHRRLSAHVPTAEGRRGAPVPLPAPPAVSGVADPYAALVRQLKLDRTDRLLLALALAPQVAPALLDPFLLHNEAIGRRFSEFGGWLGQAHAGFLPTVQTALFLLAGQDARRHLALSPLTSSHPRLFDHHLLVLDHRHPDEPPASAALRLAPSALARLQGHADLGAPRSIPDFPAQQLTTPLDWKDLVLDERTQEQVAMIGRWLRHADTLLEDWGLGKRLKRGYRCLFHGPPGTGKTLTAALLGKRHRLPVYRVDLSQVVSKWIGETEKNLAALFDRAENERWILFFDEADALFGKRTEVRSANDRSSNQQLAYLLQRIEDFPGVVILATNQSAYLDDAFARRFQSSISFPMPDAAARRRLWLDSFGGEGFGLDPEIDFAGIAEKYEMSGGAILNVLRYAALLAAERQPPTILNRDVVSGVRRELRKDA